MTLLIVTIILALVFDYINGFHDAANSIATIVSTKVLTPFQAVLWAALFNTVAFFIFKDHAVANTIGKTVYKEFITMPVIFSGLIAAIIWNLLTWWYGIPSSSSHTLIGGFAGAALTAAWMNDTSLTVSQIVDSSKIIKTLSFIVFAPLIGMVISMFFTLVMINRNTWIKCGILLLMSVGIWFMFQKFQDDKIVENLSKFYRIDKYSKVVSDETIKLEKAKNEEEKSQIQNKITEAQSKINVAETALDISKKHIGEYETKGADWVANQIEKDANLDFVIKSRINDKLNSYFKIEQLKVLSEKDPSKLNSYQLAKQAVDTLKTLQKYYFEGGFETMINQMILKQHISIPELPAFREKMKMNVHKELASEIEKANNKMLRWFMIGGLFIFILTFIYSEQIKEPNASRQANVFKRLQLLSSAGFSIGHGGNDAQKVMGIISAALVANGNIIDIKDMPNWVPIACYAAIGLGTLSGGWKIVKTMGTRITKVTPLEGVCAETAGATTLFLTEQMGIPVSTTHTITGSIIGVGATKRLSAVRWGVTVNLMWAWILTIPVSAALAAICYFIFNLFA